MTETQVLEARLDALLERLDGIAERLEKAEDRFVTHAEFWPVKALVFGGVGTALTAVVVALLALVVKG